MLVNWKVEYTVTVPEDKQPPDYDIKGRPYWFFRYFPNADEIDVDVVDIRSFPWLERFEKNKLRFYIWQTVKCLPRLKKYDMVISHGMQSGIVLCLWRRLFGKGSYKHVVFDIGAFNSARESGRSLKLMQFASRSLDGVIYHTRSQKSYYEKCHPWLLDCSWFVRFGTDADYFQKKFPNNKKKEYILCVGYDKRDWTTLLKAYRRVNTTVALRLIGNQNIEEADSRVEIIGHIGIEELKEQIANALFCVLPLKQFNYSYGQMTLLQQMAMGKAVIVADVSSIQAYIGDMDVLLYEPENDTMLQKQMERLLEDRCLMMQIGEKAEKAVRELYNEREMALEISEILQKIMKGK